MKLTVLLLAAAASAFAGTFEWWQAADAPLLDRARITAVVHTQVRMRHHWSELFQGRIGPLVRVPLRRGWGMTLGYYLTEAEGKERWTNTHRMFALADRSLHVARGTFTSRTGFEYYIGGGFPQDRRFRQLVSFSFHSRLSPYVGSETFFDRHGFTAQRVQGGVRPALSRGFLIDVGCLYDFRRTRVGQDRFVLQTSIRPRRRG